MRSSLRARGLGIDVLVRILVSYDEVAPVVGMACERLLREGAREIGGLVETVPISLGPGCKSREVPEVYAGRLQKLP